MAGGTHVFDMIKRQKENAKLRNKKHYFNKELPTSHSNSKLDDGLVETQQHHAEILRMKRREKISEIGKVLIILGFSVLVVSLLLVLFLRLF